MKKPQAPIVALPQTVQSNFLMTTYGNLVRSTGNVRTITKKSGGMSIQELAQSIFVNGLLQNLVVTEETKKGKKTGKYAVEAGGRRRAALDFLHSEGKIDLDFPVPINLKDAGEATSASLIENVQREAMHTADLYLAFKKMAEEENLSVAEIAARMACTPQTVYRGLKLAGVSPVLFQLYCDDGITGEQLIALAVSDDHEAQETAWNTAPHWQRTPQQLRARLTEKEIFSTNSLAVFVGVDDYVAAGGAVRKDLFSENDECYLLDPELLTRLATEKLEAAAQNYRDAGWLWVSVEPRLNEQAFYANHRLNAPVRNPTKAEKKALSLVEKKLKDLEAAQTKLETDADDDSDYGEDWEALNEQVEATQEEISALKNTLRDWTPELMEISGVVVCVVNGSMVVHAGLVRPEDKKMAAKVNGVSAGAGSMGIEPKEKGEFSEKLTLNLTAHRTAAIQAVLATRPDVALVVITHKLASSVFGLYADNAVQISVQRPMLTTDAPELPETAAGKAIEKVREEWVSKLPEESEELFSWLLAQSQEEVLSLLAFCTAETVNTTSGDPSTGIGKAFPYMAALNMDMADWWQPTKASFFDHVRKDKAVATVEAIVSKEAAAPLLTMKKDALGTEAEKLVAGKRWLPSLMQSAE